MVLHQHKAAQVGAEVTRGPRGQRRDDRLAIWRYPAFAPVADRMHRQHKLLDQIGLVALEARPRRGSDLQHPILDTPAPPDGAARASLPLPAGLSWLSGLVHAAWLDVRPALQSLQPRDLLALLGNGPFQFGTLLEQTA